MSLDFFEMDIVQTLRKNIVLDIDVLRIKHAIEAIQCFMRDHGFGTTRAEARRVIEDATDPGAILDFGRFKQRLEELGRSKMN